MGKYIGATSRPSSTLIVANGIVQGVNSGIQAYQNRQMTNMKIAAMREQAQAMAEYRQAQAAALREKTMPIDVDLGQIYAIGQAVQGKFIPENVGNGLIRDAGKNLMDKLNQNPSMLPYATQRIGQISKAQGATDQPQPPELHQTMGQQEQPESNGNPYAGMKIQMSPGTAQFARGIIGNMTSQNIATGKNQTQLEVAQLNNDTKLQLQELIKQGKVDLQNLVNNGAQEIQKLRNEGLLGATKQKVDASIKNTEATAQSRKDVANINAGAKVKAAQINANKKAASKTAKDPILDGQVKMLVNTNKSIDDAIKAAQNPQSPFYIRSPNDLNKFVQDQNAKKAENEQKLLSLRGGQPAAPQPSAPQIPMMAAQNKPQTPSAVQWDLKSPPPKVGVGTILQTPKGTFKVINDNGDIEPVTGGQ